MALALDLLSPTDKPALVAATSPDIASACESALSALGYKVHRPIDHDDFQLRFAQTPYQLVLIEDGFGGGGLSGNSSLQRLQMMAMSQRRHATVILIGDSFHTLHAMEAFQQSVHAVINRSDCADLNPIVQKVVADNDLFLSAYRESQLRLAQGK